MGMPGCRSRIGIKLTVQSLTHHAFGQGKDRIVAGTRFGRTVSEGAGDSTHGQLAHSGAKVTHS